MLKIFITIIFISTPGIALADCESILGEIKSALNGEGINIRAIMDDMKVEATHWTITFQNTNKEDFEQFVEEQLATVNDETKGRPWPGLTMTSQKINQVPKNENEADYIEKFWRTLIFNQTGYKQLLEDANPEEQKKLIEKYWQDLLLSTMLAETLRRYSPFRYEKIIGSSFVPVAVPVEVYRNGGP